MAWELYALTGSALDLGLVGLVQFVPMVLLTLVVGHVADRYDRRLIVIACEVVKAAVAVALAAGAIGGWQSRGLIFGLIALLAAAQAFENPAMSALVPEVVDRALIAPAMAWVVSAGQTAQIVGPALGGVLYVFGPGATYLTAGALFALAGGLVVVAAARRRAWPLAAAAATVGIAVAWVHVFPHVGPTGHWTRADLVRQRAIAKEAGGVCNAGALSGCEPSIRSHLSSLREGLRTVVHHPQGFGLGNAGQTAKRSGTPIRAGESNYTELGVELGLLGTVLWTLWGLTVLAWLLRARGALAAGVAAAFAATLALAVQTDVIGDPWVAYCVWALAGAVAARGTSRVPVALNEAVASPPSASASRSAEAAVTSAVTAPMRTRTRFPRDAIERISPRRWLRGESSAIASPTDTSQG